MRIYRHFEPSRECVLFEGDCLDLLREIPAGSIDLTVTSPPYCMGKPYEASRQTEHFIEAHKRVLPEIVRATREGGSICWQVGYHVKNGTVAPLDYYVYQIFSEYPELFFRNRIIWSFGFGLHCKHRFSGRHEVIMWYTKGREYYFDLDSVRVPQKYPGKRHYKGPRKGEYSGNPKGKNPSDVWEIPNVKANHVEKTDHPCQFPVGLAQRLIRALTPRGARILDPYMGSAATGVAAVVEGRKFVGAEIVPKYYTMCWKRVKRALGKKIRYRAYDKPVLEPDLHTCVARNPFGMNEG